MRHFLEKTTKYHTNFFYFCLLAWCFSFSCFEKLVIFYFLACLLLVFQPADVGYRVLGEDINEIEFNQKSLGLCLVRSILADSFPSLQPFLRQMEHFLTDMSNRVEHQKLNQVTAELPPG